MRKNFNFLEKILTLSCLKNDILIKNNFIFSTLFLIMRIITQLLKKGIITVNKEENIFESDILIIYIGIGSKDTEETKEELINFINTRENDKIFLISSYKINGRLKGKKFDFSRNMTKEKASLYFSDLINQSLQKNKNKSIYKGVFSGYHKVYGVISKTSILDF